LGKSPAAATTRSRSSIRPERLPLNKRAKFSENGTIPIFHSPQTYMLALGSASRQNQTPAMKIFVADPEWKQFSFPIASFETDGHDITNLAFAHDQEPGKFEFEIDQLEIK
jgi:hypothetical protein